MDTIYKEVYIYQIKLVHIYCTDIRSQVMNCEVTQRQNLFLYFNFILENWSASRLLLRCLD